MAESRLPGKLVWLPQAEGQHSCHPDAVSFQHRLQKVMLGAEVAQVCGESDARQNEELFECLGKTASKLDSHDPKLALEIYLTSVLFKGVAGDVAAVDGEVCVDLFENQERYGKCECLGQYSQRRTFPTVYLFSLKSPYPGHVEDNTRQHKSAQHLITEGNTGVNITSNNIPSAGRLLDVHTRKHGTGHCSARNTHLRGT